MFRITKARAVVSLAGGLAVGAFALSSPAMATSPNDGLVNVSLGNVIVQPNVPISVAANLCNINVNAVSHVDTKGGKTECKALSTSTTKAWVIQ